MNAKEVAGLTGVSVRTLHHYDNIGLLSPRRNRDNEYRVYSGEDLDRLQQILFFRECGFSLKRIGELLASPSFDREQAFALQRSYLLHEKKRINAMLHTLDKTMQAMKGEITMSQQEKFGGFDMSHNPYEAEARRLWGDAAIDESKSHIESLSYGEKDDLARGMEALFVQLAGLRGEAPGSSVAQDAMDRMYRYFNGNLGHRYSPEAFAGVGQLYITDPRFTENVDRYGEGLSQFLAEAMGLYAKGLTE